MHDTHYIDDMHDTRHRWHAWQRWHAWHTWHKWHIWHALVATTCHHLHSVPVTTVKVTMRGVVIILTLLTTHQTLCRTVKITSHTYKLHSPMWALMSSQGNWRKTTSTVPLPGELSTFDPVNTTLTFNLHWPLTCWSSPPPHPSTGTVHRWVSSPTSVHKTTTHPTHTVTWS